VTTRITGIADKGSGAPISYENNAADAAGSRLITMRSGAFFRGEGGFEGERGSSDPWTQPDHSPGRRSRRRFSGRDGGRACRHDNGRFRLR
jgi:hypothetical protein